jgi:hypothetical protein
MLTPPPCSRNRLNKGTAIRAGAIVAASAAKVFDFSTNSSQMVAKNLGVAATSWPLLSSQSHCGHINPAAFLLEEQTERINGSHWVVPAIVAAASSKAS